MSASTSIVADVQAEEAVLGAMLVSGRAVVDVLEAGLTAGDFYRGPHQALAAVIFELADQGLPHDVIATAAELDRRGSLDAAGGRLFVADLAQRVPSPAEAGYYAGIVADQAGRRRAVELSQEIRRSALNGSGLAGMRAPVEQLRALIDGTPAAIGPGPLIPLLSPAEIASKAPGSAGWLIRGLWPADSYGILGAEDKAGKTFAILDLAVSVATGTAWLEHFPCDPGPVVLYLGEGGGRSIHRRLAAIVGSRGGTLEDLTDLRVGLAVPRLLDGRYIDEMRRELAAAPARLVVIDPLYLAAAGAKLSDLYGMGEALGRLQAVCQEAGCALVVITHWNKTGSGSGAARFTGVGPGAWGRVLGSAAVEQRRIDADGTSDVLLRWAFTGGEIPDRSFRLRRLVRASDPDDLDSPLTYRVEVSEDDLTTAGGLSVSRERVLAALKAADCPLSVREIGDRLAADGAGPPLKRRTIDDALKDLLELAHADGSDPEPGRPRTWWAR